MQQTIRALTTVLALTATTPVLAGSKQILKNWPICTSRAEAVRLGQAWLKQPQGGWQFLIDDSAVKSNQHTVRQFPHCEFKADRPGEPGIRVDLTEAGKYVGRLSRRYVTVVSAERTNQQGITHQAYTVLIRYLAETKT